MDTPKLKDAILEFYRGELRRRYQLENVRHFPHFDEIEDLQIEALREFFLDRIYPPVDERHKLDKAFEHLGLVMYSPRRLRPLMTTAIASALRMGHRFPSAIAAGLATIDAYREARKLEACMMRNALEMDFSAADTKKRSRMIHLIVAVPDEDVLRLIHDIMKLFQALSNVKMLETAVRFMEICRDVVERRRDLYGQEDWDGFNLGRDVIQGGLDLFRQLRPEDFPNIISGIEAIELEWFERVKAEAAA
ncbi:MAG: hypothetical protein HYV26_07840 [Candidatus Hydrogenedentes bacterium]|nr:hypothetical protein [Candidatus Hydrogenedentota bacterium]